MPALRLWRHIVTMPSGIISYYFLAQLCNDRQFHFGAECRKNHTEQRRHLMEESLGHYRAPVHYEVYGIRQRNVKDDAQFTEVNVKSGVLPSFFQHSSRITQAYHVLR